MNYSSFTGQAYHLFHFFLSFSMIFLLLPRLLFRPVSGTSMDRVVSWYMRMVFFVITTGYLLLITKLYEALGFLFVVVIVLLVRRSRSGKVPNTVSATAMALFYDAVEARYLIQAWFRQLRTWIQGQKERVSVVRIRWTPTTVEFLLLIVILAASVYIRATDAVTTPAPPMSDGYVSLAWTKYINNRILFHDGIYPQGLYFYLSIIGKFAFIDLVYILKYVGALNNILIVVGLYYTIARWTGQRGIGLLVAAVYGVFGHWLLAGDWSRQAAIESQEFGFLFVAPTMYFVHRYLKNGERIDFDTSVAGLFVTGLIHPLAYILCLLGCLSVWVAHLVVPGPFTRARLVRVLFGGLVSGGVTLAPVGIGFAFGKGWNASSASFAAATTSSSSGPSVSMPALHAADYMWLTALLILVIASVWVLKVHSDKHHAWISGAVYGLCVSVVYYLGDPLTHSVVIEVRALDMWAVAFPVVVGFAIHVLVYLSGRASGVVRWINCTVSATMMCAAFPTGALQPIIPYKMQYDDGVQEYLNINQDFRYSGYMLVANNEEYVLVLGNGYNMSIADFVKTYDPTKPPLTRYGSTKPDYGIAPSVFIYYPKHIYEVSKNNDIYSLEAPIYASRKKDKQNLSAWIATYRRFHSLHVYYEDSNLIVYQIDDLQPPKQQKYLG